MEPRGNYDPRLENGHLQTGRLKWGILKYPVSQVLNFKSWISLIYDKITLKYCVENAFNSTLKFKTLKRGVSKCPICKRPFHERGIQLPLSGISLNWDCNELLRRQEIHTFHMINQALF